MAFQINGNTIIDSSGSLIVNANTSIANNFSVQLTPFASRESTSPMQGTVAGFTAGGDDGSSPPTENSTIDKFPFTNELTAVDHGNLTVARRLLSGHSSDTHGFTAGGYEAAQSPTNVNTINKYAFSTNVTASDHGDLSTARRELAGQSSTTDGFTSGGAEPPGNATTIDKFAFATNTTATDVGDLSQARARTAGNSSESDGYTSGGFADINTNDKFPFAISAGTATDVGDLSVGRSDSCGQSSKTSGYVSGGLTAVPATVDRNVIDKFPFSTDTNSSDVGDLANAQRASAGQSSREHGYVSGGGKTTPTQSVMIQKFPFATDTNASDVGSLTTSRGESAGAQD